MYNFVTVYGLSGSGKDYIIEELIKMFPHKFHHPKSWITRPIEERDYYIDEKGNKVPMNNFVTKEEFEEKLKNDRVVSYTKFGEHQYAVFESEFEKDKINIRAIDPVGILSTKLARSDINIITLEIKTEDKKRFERTFDKMIKGMTPETSVTEYPEKIQKILERMEREVSQYKYIDLSKDSGKHISVFNNYEFDDDLLNNKEYNLKKLYHKINKLSV